MTKQFNILVEIKPTCIDDFVDWQADFNSKICHIPGFTSLEFLLLSKQQKRWSIVKCFYYLESFTAWHCTKEYQQLIDKLKTLVLNENVIEVEGDESSGKGNVTE